MNRRELLAGAGALAVSACGPQQPAASGAGAGPAVAPSANPFAGDRLMKDVETYVGFGTHRTGSAGDLATSDWFARRWRDLGYEIEQTEFTLPNADTTVARLEGGGVVLEGFGQPPLAFTAQGGLMAPLIPWNPKSPLDVNRSIAVVHLPRAAGTIAAMAAYREAFVRCKESSALGVVALMSSPSGELAAINTPAEMLMEIPVVMFGEKDKPKVDAMIASRQPVKLTLEGPGGFRNGKNTVARYGATGPWVIVSTPQSGWFTCGGERGPGIAMSLALSDWAMARKFPVRFLFVATSGHEWADAGAHVFHEHQAPDPGDTMLWFHLGAGFGARQYDETPEGLKPADGPNLTRTLMMTNDLLASGRAAFAGHPVIGQPLAADVARSAGEYTLVLKEGYPSAAGFWGAHGLFHTPIDGADATSGALMEPIARAIAKVIEERIARG
jgi:hypothetical protein